MAAIWSRPQTVKRALSNAAPCDRTVDQSTTIVLLSIPPIIVKPRSNAPLILFEARYQRNIYHHFYTDAWASDCIHHVTLISFSCVSCDVVSNRGTYTDLICFLEMRCYTFVDYNCICLCILQEFTLTHTSNLQSYANVAVGTLNVTKWSQRSIGYGSTKN